MNSIDLTHRCAVVTGGAQGFGRAITERFINSGARVAIWDHDIAFAERTAKEIGDAVTAIQVDVSADKLIHRVKNGNDWNVIDSWTEPGRNFTEGKFGFLVQGNDEIGVSDFKFTPR